MLIGKYIFTTPRSRSSRSSRRNGVLRQSYFLFIWYSNALLIVAIINLFFQFARCPCSHLWAAYTLHTSRSYFPRLWVFIRALIRWLHWYFADISDRAGSEPWCPAESWGHPTGLVLWASTAGWAICHLIKRFRVILIFLYVISAAARQFSTLRHFWPGLWVSTSDTSWKWLQCNLQSSFFCVVPRIHLQYPICIWHTLYFQYKDVCFSESESRFQANRLLPLTH